jgi:hypothetical protein
MRRRVAHDRLLAVVTEITLAIRGGIVLAILTA